MESIRNLGELLRGLDPLATEPEYVFCCLTGEDAERAADLDSLSTFREDEGVTVVVARDAADRQGLPYQATFRRIILRVHSSLEAVGLTAAVSTALAGAGISANVIAAYHHDHIFVPAADVNRAMDVLRDLQAESGGE